MFFLVYKRFYSTSTSTRWTRTLYLERRRCLLSRTTQGSVQSINREDKDWKENGKQHIFKRQLHSLWWRKRCSSTLRKSCIDGSFSCSPILFLLLQACSLFLGMFFFVISLCLCYFSCNLFRSLLFKSRGAKENIKHKLCGFTYEVGFSVNVEKLTLQPFRRRLLPGAAFFVQLLL